MQSKVKMYSESLGCYGNSVVRLKRGWLPQFKGSVGSLVEFHNPDNSRIDVVIGSHHETYGEPAGGIYEEHLLVGVRMGDKTYSYDFSAPHVDRKAKIDFDEIVPEGREFVEAAVEAEKQFFEHVKNRTGKEDSFQIMSSEEYSAFVNKKTEKTMARPKKPAIKEKIKNLFKIGKEIS